MTPTAPFVHLVFNHIPVIGIPFAAALLAGGMIAKSRDVIVASFAAFLIVGLLTIPADRSGGPAAHMIRQIPGIERSAIHAHAEAADKAFAGVLLLGLAGLIGFWMAKRGGPGATAYSSAVLFFAILVSAWLAWTAHLGGLIRHPEISSSFNPGGAAAASPTGPSAAAMPGEPAPAAPSR